MCCEVLGKGVFDTSLRCTHIYLNNIPSPIFLVYCRFISRTVFVVMLSEFITYLQDHELLRLSRDRLLVAVSGGMDSMTLLHLCQRARINIGMAHCNFQLRGEESDQDAVFIRQIAQTLGLPYYETQFETQTLADTKGQSIQVAARQLRYAWLEEIREQHGYTHIGVAHHQNDVIETLLINLTKGCGIRGLHGIYPKRGTLVRPLLFATREAIEQYVKEEGIAYREDSSNANTHYVRNALRHQLVPILKQLNPYLEKTFAQNIAHFRDTERLYHYAIQQLKAAHTFEQKGRFWINIEGVAQSPAPESLLYELLLPYDFKPRKIHYIYRSREEESGAIYTSPTHQLLKNREHWIVQPIPNPDTPQRIVLSDTDSYDTVVLPPHHKLFWSLTTFLDQAPPAPTIAPEHVNLDASKLNFPLHLRHWRAGDVFFPVGMGGKQKKVSKFFKDLKIHRFEKDEIWLLCTADDDIAWIIGYRADERFIAKTSTPRVWEGSLKELS